MERCRDALDKCSHVVAWLDGAQVDDGTAWEVGYAYAKSKSIHGIHTDFRQAGDTTHSIVNAMIEGGLFECDQVSVESVQCTTTRCGHIQAWAT